MKNLSPDWDVIEHDWGYNGFIEDYSYIGGGSSNINENSWVGIWDSKVRGM